jgi:hypothetical protein
MEPAHILKILMIVLMGLFIGVHNAWGAIQGYILSHLRFTDTSIDSSFGMLILLVFMSSEVIASNIY